jgi:hypothetical protein
LRHDDAPTFARRLADAARSERDSAHAMIGSPIMNGVDLPDMPWFDDGKTEK